jgi:DNA-binding XRE family transcriptional regulator
MNNKTEASYEKWRNEQLKNPELRKLYEEEAARFNVSQKIKKLRESLGLSQRQLAKLTKTSQAAIARIENTNYEGHSLSKLNEIAFALHTRLVIDFVPIYKNKHKKSA